jgi:hypothetical protein
MAVERSTYKSYQHYEITKKATTHSTATRQQKGEQREEPSVQTISKKKFGISEFASRSTSLRLHEPRHPYQHHYAIYEFSPLDFLITPLYEPTSGFSSENGHVPGLPQPASRQTEYHKGGQPVTRLLHNFDCVTRKGQRRCNTIRVVQGSPSLLLHVARRSRFVTNYNQQSTIGTYPDPHLPMTQGGRRGVKTSETYRWSFPPDPPNGLFRSAGYMMLQATAAARSPPTGSPLSLTHHSARYNFSKDCQAGWVKRLKSVFPEKNARQKIRFVRHKPIAQQVLTFGFSRFERLWGTLRPATNKKRRGRSPLHAQNGLLYHVQVLLSSS